MDSSNSQDSLEASSTRLQYYLRSRRSNNRPQINLTLNIEGLQISNSTSPVSIQSLRSNQAPHNSRALTAGSHQSFSSVSTQRLLPNPVYIPTASSSLFRGPTIRPQTNPPAANSNIWTTYREPQRAGREETFNGYPIVKRAYENLKMFDLSKGHSGSWQEDELKVLKYIYTVPMTIKNPFFPMSCEKDYKEVYSDYATIDPLGHRDFKCKYDKARYMVAKDKKNGSGFSSIHIQ